MNQQIHELAEIQAEIYGIFSNAKRVLIFWLLNGTEMAVNEIAAEIETSIQNTSQHLRLMKGKRILTSRRDGQTIYYRITNNEFGKYCQLIHKDNLDRLPREEVARIFNF